MPKVSLEDISLKNCGLTERVSHLRDVYFRAVPQMCIERPRLITRFALDSALFNRERISILDKAKTYRYVLKNRIPIVRHNKACEKNTNGKKLKTFDLENKYLSLFAGSTTGKFKGVEQMANVT